MFRKETLAAAALSLGLLLSGAAGTTAAAGRGGGRNFSAGRVSSSTHGRSYSSGRAVSSHSYPSSGSPKGRSYSTGSTSGKAANSYGRPAAVPSPSKPPVRSNPDVGRIPAGRRYSSGDSPLSGKTHTTESRSTKPSSGSFDASAARSQKMAESKVAYQKGQQPKSSYTDPAGGSHPVDAKDRKIEALRGELNRERWENRQVRQQQVFGRYYTYQPPPVVYHDPYSTFFWLWLLDRSLDTRAYWAYNHRQSMDDARYRDLLAHDANLEARIRQLETEHVPHDPTYRPDNIDPDLMYNKSYVDAAYNPQPTLTASSPQPTSASSSPPAPSAPAPSTSIPSRPSSSGGPIRAMSTVFIVLGVIALIIWLVFYKRWGGIGG